MDDFDIDIGQGSNIHGSKDVHSEMQSEISKIVDILSKPYNEFTDKECENVYTKIKDYINKYERLLYSTVSNKIYHVHKANLNDNSIEDILTNLEKLMRYCYSKDSEVYKITVKIWDHVNLAHQQYQELHLSDKEYQEKFSNQMKAEKERLYREINGHMVTMIGIFTALSFVIFGGINSIETAFAGVGDAPLSKLMVIGGIWSFGLLNLVYIFLYCIAKLNNLNFKNNEKKNANFVQRYQFIVMPNFFIVALLIISLWMYFATSNNLFIEIIKVCQDNQWGFVSMSIIIFVLVIWYVGGYITNMLKENITK